MEHRRGANGLPLNGIAVYVIWLIEAGIIFYISVKRTTKAAQQPFNEKLNLWASEKQQVMTLPISDEAMVAKIKSAARIEDLLEIPIPKTSRSKQFAVYQVSSVPGEEMEDAYLAVDLVTISINKEGHQEKKTKPLVRNAILPIEQRKHLMENATLLQEAMAEYEAALIAEAQQEQAPTATQAAGDDDSAQAAGIDGRPKPSDV